MKKPKRNLPAVVEPIEVKAEEIKRHPRIGIKISTNFTPDPDLVRKLAEEIERRKRLKIEGPIDFKQLMRDNTK